MNDLTSICTFDSLYRAFQQTKRGKRHKIEVIKFEENLSVELTNLQESLLNGTYKMSQYNQFYVYEPKKRIVYACSYRDRVVLRWLCNEVLSPLLLPVFIYDNGACQPQKGPLFSRKRLSYHLTCFYKEYQTNGFALIGDISQYFSSIDQTKLKEILKPFIKDGPLFSFMTSIIDSFDEIGSGKGLPLGNQTSQYFSLLYLHFFDRFIKEELKIKYYVRYMDDFILIHPDKSYLDTCYRQITWYLEENLKIKLNPKTKIIPIASGIPYLGFRFILTSTGKVRIKQKKEAAKRVIKRIKHSERQFSLGKLSSKELQGNLLGSKSE